MLYNTTFLGIIWLVIFVCQFAVWKTIRTHKSNFIIWYFIYQIYAFFTHFTFCSFSFIHIPANRIELLSIPHEGIVLPLNYTGLKIADFLSFNVCLAIYLCSYKEVIIVCIFVFNSSRWVNNSNFECSISIYKSLFRISCCINCSRNLFSRSKSNI